MDYRIIEGDLFESDAPAIGHGVNTHGVMGAGIAVLFKRKFGKDYFEEYQRVCDSTALRPGKIHVWHDPRTEKYVINIASQDAPGPHASMAWITQALTRFEYAIEQINFYQETKVDRLAIPAIGCGIGGLKFESLTRLLDKLTIESYSIDLHVLD